MNLELVEQIVSVLGEYPVTEITVEQEGRRVRVRRPAGVAPGGPPHPEAVSAVEAGESPTEPESSPAPEPLRTLTATMVGIFHHAAPPVSYGGSVAPGQRIGFIESMKLMNDVPAEAGGRVAEVLVEDGAPVEYGQSLFRLAAE